MTWRKSSFSAPNGNCVELGEDGRKVLVRNGNRAAAGTLPLSREAVGAFVDACRHGELDHLTG